MQFFIFCSTSLPAHPTRNQFRLRDKSPNSFLPLEINKCSLILLYFKITGRSKNWHYFKHWFGFLRNHFFISFTAKFFLHWFIIFRTQENLSLSNHFGAKTTLWAYFFGLKLVKLCIGRIMATYIFKWRVRNGLLLFLQHTSFSPTHCLHWFVFSFPRRCCVIYIFVHFGKRGGNCAQTHTHVYGRHSMCMGMAGKAVREGWKNTEKTQTRHTTLENSIPCNDQQNRRMKSQLIEYGGRKKHLRTILIRLHQHPHSLLGRLKFWPFLILFGIDFITKIRSSSPDFITYILHFHGM